MPKSPGFRGVAAEFRRELGLDRCGRWPALGLVPVIPFPGVPPCG